jgi:hypothetical protein
MKTVNHFFLNALLIGFIFMTVAGCKKKDETPVPVIGSGNGELNFTINGDGFANKNYSTSKGVTLAFYDASDNSTAVGINDGEATATKYTMFALDFSGKNTGTFSINDDDDDDSDEDVNIYLAIKDGSVDKSFVAQSGTIVVTKYPSVGGKIEGTFSGTFVNVVNQTTVTVSNGKFAAQRLQDQQ